MPNPDELAEKMRNAAIKVCSDYSQAAKAEGVRRWERGESASADIAVGVSAALRKAAERIAMLPNPGKAQS